MKFNESFQARFAAKTGKPTANGCTEWTGYTDKHGYARIRIDGNRSTPQELVHRAIFTCAHGAIPERMVVMHTCDNPKCVNLAHLVLGTSKDNTSDMIVKGRHGWRVETPWQKLSSADAKIVKRLRAMELSQQRIADMMNVSRPLISMLLGGKLQYA